MKNLTFSFKIAITFTLFIIYSSSAEAKDVIEKTKTITKEFDVSEDTRIQISNSHGNITIQTWDSKKAKIEAFIKVKADDEESIKNLSNQIEIKAEKQGLKNVTIETKLKLISNIIKESNKKTYQKLKFRDGTIIKVKKYEVNYIITIPSSNPIEIESSFHDVIFENDIIGETNIKMTSGNLIGKNFAKNLNLRLIFSDAKFDKVTNIELKMTSSKLELKKAKNIDFDGRFSDLLINNANEITSNTTSCNLNINVVNTILGESRFGTMIIDHLVDRFYFKGTNTSITINKIKNEFQEVYLHNSSFSNLKLHFDNKPQYLLKYYVQFGSVQYPKDEFNMIHKNNNEISGNMEQVYATTKYAPENIISTVKVDGINNTLKIYHQ